MDAERYTVEELSTVTGHTVRNIRYYTTLGLLPAPEKQGRIAVYGADHRARLELITSLQEHGFTLEAIGRYLERRGTGATVEDLAMQRAMITSWTSESPDDVQARIGRELLKLGLPRDALAAAHDATTRHMTALAEELDGIVRTQIVDVFARTAHSTEEAERFEKGLPRLRDLTVEAVVVAFQGAVNRLISRSLERVR
ncbi:MerR family transcriptional regulator [Nocardioides sp. Kera G14]|uniref:MerR family transcriptional regulator n=1 Tax=Nocardioides sp. Kera G14 TaxID=2884264 RepID=UPI001D128FE3|nr:MerR family transcriptional regulator [Nocardioides sp. Kera G14]UDY23506.1 MerR family transcriptional regulator [Nocardioides sp. Kera G14]